MTCAQNLQGMDYTVKSKLFLERVLDIELRGPEDRCLLYEDPSPSFPRLFFHGQEWSLWQLELLVFAVVDLIATDYVIAAVITAVIAGVCPIPRSDLLIYFLSLSPPLQVVSVVREVLGRRNLARKTLVDNRFLI